MKTIGYFILISSIFISNVFADCSDILKDGIFNLEITQIDSSNKSEALILIANNNYEDKTTKKGALLSAIWNKIPIKLSYNEENYNTIKNDYSYLSNTSSSTNTNIYIYRRLANEKIIDGWIKCKKGQDGGFYYEIDSLSDGVYKFKPVFDTIQNLSLNLEDPLLDNIEVKLGSFPNLIKSQNPVVPVFLKKIDQNQMSLIVLYGNDDKGNSHSIDISIPPKVPEPDYEKIKAMNLFYDMTPVDFNDCYIPPANCWSRCHEITSIKEVKINSDKTVVSIVWESVRSNCYGVCDGKSWNEPNVPNLQGKASANIKIVGGLLSIDKNSIVVNINIDKPLGDFCGPEVIKKHIENLDGQVL